MFVPSEVPPAAQRPAPRMPSQQSRQGGGPLCSLKCKRADVCSSGSLDALAAIVSGDIKTPPRTTSAWRALAALRAEAIRRDHAVCVPSGRQGLSPALRTPRAWRSSVPQLNPGLFFQPNGGRAQAAIWHGNLRAHCNVHHRGGEASRLLLVLNDLRRPFNMSRSSAQIERPTCSMPRNLGPFRLARFGVCALIPGAFAPLVKYSMKSSRT